MIRKMMSNENISTQVDQYHEKNSHAKNNSSLSHADGSDNDFDR